MRPTSVAVWVLLAATLLMTVSVGSASAETRLGALPGPAAGDLRPYRPGAVRPTSIDVYKDALFYRLRWRDWGRAYADGAGWVRENTCVPSCAAGRIVRRPGLRLTASRVRVGRCQGRRMRFYTRLTHRLPGHRGASTLELLPRC